MPTEESGNNENGYNLNEEASGSPAKQFNLNEEASGSPAKQFNLNEEASAESATQQTKEVESAPVEEEAPLAPLTDTEPYIPTLGDTVIVNYTDESGVPHEHTGIIYTFTIERFLIRKEGNPTEVVEFPIIQTDDGYVINNPEYPLDIKPIKKRTPAIQYFLEIDSIQPGQLVRFYKDNKHVHDEDVLYEVEAINSENDSAKFVRKSDDGSVLDTIEVKFNVHGDSGIPKGEDFDVIYVVNKEKPASEEEIAAAAAAIGEGTEPPALDDSGDEMDPELAEFFSGIISGFRAVDVATTVIEQQTKTEFSEEDKLESFLQDWRERLSATDLKNPSIRRSDVALVQAFNLLRKTILEADGANVKMRDLVIETLGQLLKNKKMPLAIPVLKTKRLITTENLKVTSFDDDELKEQLVLHNFQGDIEGYNERMEAVKNVQSTQQIGDEDTQATKSLYAFLQEQILTFPLGDIGLYNTKDGVPIRADTDFFRESIPISDGESGIFGIANVEEVNKKGIVDHVENYDPNTYIKRNIPFSLRRALEKQSEGELTQKVNILGHVLFPYESTALGVTGAKRSGRLWESMKRGSMPKIPMNFLVNKEFYGPVDTESTNPNQAIYFKADNDPNQEGENANNIDFKDKYLGTILKSMFYEGPADVHPLKLDLGIEDYELTVDQMSILKDRIVQIITILEKYIGTLRKEALDQASAPVQAKDNSFSPEQVTIYRQLEATYEPLKKVINTIAECMPNYSSIDIAIVAQCLREIPDYFFAVLTSGQPEKIATEEERLKHTQYKQNVYNMIKQAVYDDESKIQYKPERRKCGETPDESHYKAMEVVRSRGDFTLRMRAFEQVIRDFLQTNKDPLDPWFKCKVCKDNLICQHEWMQYQQYKNPTNYASIQKDIILNYAGGSFGANYICRNCGLPIADIGFDIKTELREGSAMEVMLDEEQQRKQEEETMNIVTKISDTTTGDKQKDMILPAAKDLYFSMGVEFDTLTFFQNVYPMMDYCIKQQLTQSDFKGKKDEPEAAAAEVEAEAVVEENGADEESKSQEGGAKEGVKTGKPGGKSGKRPDGKKITKKAQPKKQPEDKQYIEYKNRNQIGALLAAMLVEFQTASPEYQLGIKTASEELDGYPLYPTPEPVYSPEAKNRTNSDGVSRLLLYSIAMPKNKNPWKQLNLKEDNLKENFDTMKPFLEKNIKLLLKRGTIQGLYRQKRKELDEARTERKEILPTNFFPILQPIPTGIQTVPEGAKQDKTGNAMLAAKWIATANGFAKETGLATSGYKFMEGACCIVEKSVVEPGKFWKEASTGPMPRRDPFQAPYRRNTVTNVPFTADNLSAYAMKPAEEDKFNLFLSVCYTGPNEGRPHELHYEYRPDTDKFTYVCDWCELTVDEKFFMSPTNIDKDGKIIPYTKSEIAQIQQNVTSAGITMETDFEPLLNETNRKSVFTQYKPPSFQNRDDMFRKLAALNPPPTTSDNLVVNPIATEESELVGDWSAWVEALKEKDNFEEAWRKQIINFFIVEDTEKGVTRSPLVSKLLQKSNTDPTALSIRSKLILRDDILKKSPDVKQRVLSEYILIPAQRILSKFNPKSLKLNDKYYKLKNPELEQKINSMIETHLGYLKQESKTEEMNRTDADIQTLVEPFEQCIQACHAALSLAPEMIILSERNILWSAILVGILTDLLENTDGLRNQILVKLFLDTVLVQFKAENIAFNAEEVLLEVDKLKEKEKLSFIDDLDKMSVEDRQIELAKKKLGLGRWAVGGTSLTYKYNPDYHSELMENARRIGTYNSVAEGNIDGVEGRGGGAQDEIVELGFTREEGEEGEFDS